MTAIFSGSFSATNVEGNYFTISIDKKKTEAMDCTLASKYRLVEA